MTVPMNVTAERTQWATRISAEWQKSVDSIIETGRLLLASKADPKMQHGEWRTMVESDLPFNRHAAHKLMQIAGADECFPGETFAALVDHALRTDQA